VWVDRKGGKVPAHILLSDLTTKEVVGYMEATTKPPVKQQLNTGRPVKIAIIEDDPRVSELYKSYFTKRGYEVQQTIWMEGAHDDSAVIIAEPGEVDTTVFVRTFCDTYPNRKLVVASRRPDILRGTRFHPNTMAITKPFHMEELQEVVEVMLGAPALLMPNKG
jgi:hypothetical protein